MGRDDGRSGFGGRPLTRPRLGETKEEALDRVEGAGRHPSGLRRQKREPTRLEALTEVLLTVKSKVLGLSEQVKLGLSNGRLQSIGLVEALKEIVTVLESHQILEGETAIRSGVRLGADKGMAVHFDDAPIAAYSRRDAEGANALFEALKGPSYSVEDERFLKAEAAEAWGHVDADGDSPSLIANATITNRTAGHNVRFEDAVKGLDRAEREMLDWVVLSAFSDAPRLRLRTPNGKQHAVLVGLHHKKLIASSSSEAGWQPTLLGLKSSRALFELLELRREEAE